MSNAQQSRSRYRPSLTQRLCKACHWVKKFVDSRLWHYCGYYRKWQLARTFRRIEEIQRDPKVQALCAQPSIIPMSEPCQTPGCLNTIVSPKESDEVCQGCGHHVACAPAVLEAPQWLKDRMEALRKLPPPTLEQVEQQFAASKRQRAEMAAEYASRGVCYECGCPFPKCTCEKPNENPSGN